MEDYAELIRLAPERVIGLKQVLCRFAEGTLHLAVLARDTDADFKRRVRAAAATAGAVIIEAPSRAELGALAGIDVAAGVVGIIQ